MRDGLALREWLTDDVLKEIELLFVFRNRSMHYAYEWPRERLDAFESCIHKRGWEDSVSWAKSGGEPWMAYLKDDCMVRMLRAATSVVVGFVKVARDRGGLFRVNPGTLPGFGPGETWPGATA